jgi:hypothetical protein
VAGKHRPQQWILRHAAFLPLLHRIASGKGGVAERPATVYNCRMPRSESSEASR